MSGRIAALALAGVLAAALAAPEAAQAQREGDPLPAGAWGGEGMLLLVTAGGASAEFDCAHGQTDGAVVFAEDRRFEAAGWLVLESAGDERRRATFSGRLRRDVLTVRVRYGSAGQELGTFELRQDGKGRVNKCAGGG